MEGHCCPGATLATLVKETVGDTGGATMMQIKTAEIVDMPQKMLAIVRICCRGEGIERLCAILEKKTV